MCVLSMHFFLNSIILHIPFYCFFFLFKLTFIDHLLVLLLGIHAPLNKRQTSGVIQAEGGGGFEDMGVFIAFV